MSTAMSCGSPTVSGFLLNNIPAKKSKTSDRSSNGFRISCSSSPPSAVSDPYKTLRIHRGASESDVRKAFRKLALQYHPDVCRGNNCGVQFHEINEAYDTVMSNLREDELKKKKGEDYYCNNTDDSFRGMYDQDWDLWEEWMGWEGAGIRDYSSHINPYI